MSVVMSIVWHFRVWDAKERILVIEEKDPHVDHRDAWLPAVWHCLFFFQYETLCLIVCSQYETGCVLTVMCPHYCHTSQCARTLQCYFHKALSMLLLYSHVYDLTIFNRMHFVHNMHCATRPYRWSLSLLHWWLSSIAIGNLELISI